MLCPCTHITGLTWVDLVMMNLRSWIVFGFFNLQQNIGDRIMCSVFAFQVFALLRRYAETLWGLHNSHTQKKDWRTLSDPRNFRSEPTLFEQTLLYPPHTLETGFQKNTSSQRRTLLVWRWSHPFWTPNVLTNVSGQHNPSNYFTSSDPTKWHISPHLIWHIWSNLKAVMWQTGKNGEVPGPTAVQP